MVRFVISITTLPDRVPYIKPVIKSILDTNEEIDKIYICLPYGDVKDKHIPKNTDKVKVIRCKDYGPITKILGVLPYETDPDTLILTLDDDVIVTRKIIGVFKSKSKKYPNAVLSFSGWCYGSFPFNYQLVLNNEKDIPVDWVQGVHGILYRRSFVNKKEILNFRKDNKLLFKNDDHKIAGYLASKGIERISVNRNPVNYFKNYGPASCINPISGGSISKSMKFWNDVKTVSKEFKECGYYTRCYSYTESTVFIVGSFVILGLMLVFGGCLIGYRFGILRWWLVILLILLAILFLYSIFHYQYKEKYILDTAC